MQKTKVYIKEHQEIWEEQKSKEESCALARLVKDFARLLAGRARRPYIPSRGAYIRLKYEDATDPRSTYKAGIICLPTLEATMVILREVGFKNVTVLQNKGKLPKEIMQERTMKFYADPLTELKLSRANLHNPFMNLYK